MVIGYCESVSRGDDTPTALIRAPLWLLVLAPVVALGATPVWVLWDATRTHESSTFISTPQFPLWLLLLCASAAVWALGVIFLAGLGRSAVRGLCWRQWLSLVFAGLVLWLLLYVFVSSALTGRYFMPSEVRLAGFPESIPLVNYELKIKVLVGIPLLVGSVAIILMWATAMALNPLRPSGSDRSQPTSQDLRTFLALRRNLIALLSFAGILIGLGILSAGALRAAVLAVKLKFAQEYIVVYGLFFSGLLAVVSVPAFLALRSAGAYLRDCAYPLPAPSHPEFADVITKRKALDTLLQTNLSASATFKAGAAILTPLAGGLLTLVLPPGATQPL